MNSVDNSKIRKDYLEVLFNKYKRLEFNATDNVKCLYEIFPFEKFNIIGDYDKEIDKTEFSKYSSLSYVEIFYYDNEYSILIKPVKEFDYLLTLKLDMEIHDVFYRLHNVLRIEHRFNVYDYDFFEKNYFYYNDININKKRYRDYIEYKDLNKKITEYELSKLVRTLSYLDTSCYSNPDRILYNELYRTICKKKENIKIKFNYKKAEKEDSIIKSLKSDTLEIAYAPLNKIETFIKLINKNMTIRQFLRIIKADRENINTYIEYSFFPDSTYLFSKMYKLFGNLWINDNQNYLLLDNETKIEDYIYEAFKYSDSISKIKFEEFIIKYEKHNKIKINNSILKNINENDYEINEIKAINNNKTNNIKNISIVNNIKQDQINSIKNALKLKVGKEINNKINLYIEKELKQKINENYYFFIKNLIILFIPSLIDYILLSFENNINNENKNKIHYISEAMMENAYFELLDTISINSILSNLFDKIKI
jgi:hypothetical protein